MSTRIDFLAARKSLLLTQLRLQRMELALCASDVRAAMRPAGMIGGAIARPAATLALVESIARLFGFKRFTNVFRIGSIAYAIFRVSRSWRSGKP